MGNSVGRIDLDLVLNQNQFNRQLKGISGIAKKAGAALVAAFAVSKIIDFGKQCVELGSDLAEVQNVVAVTFPHMTAQVDSFAKNAATSFGLSETMAKKFTGTFGAMAKAFGFSESAAYDMSTTLTGLSGDVASFYNISQDEAYTKLKSVFTGETETLKDLGIVMTQSALDAYALANGYGKTTQAMSEAEKVALRYAFVQNQLSAATGDFSRTSDSWANQVRLLKLNFDSLKATIGQGLINILTPVIKVINLVISKISVLANAFKSFTELITGKKASSGVQAMSDSATEGLSSATDAAGGLSDATAGAGKSAKKAAKEMKSLMGFDQINKLSEQDSGDSGGSGGGGSGSAGSAVGSGAVDYGGLAGGETVMDKISLSCDGLLKRVKELAGLFKKGFDIGFGDSLKNIETIKKSLFSIGKSLKEIFTSKEVLSAAGNWADKVAEALGKITGAVASVAIAIVTNLTAGIAKSLEEKKDYIKQKISSLFKLSGDMWELRGNFFSALGDIISTALTSDSAISITSDICSMLITGVLGGAELFSKVGLDLMGYFMQPIIDNKDKISEAIENTLKPVATVVNTIKTAVEDAFKVINKAYDNHISPMLNTLKKGISDSFGKSLDAYNTYVAPALTKLANKFNETYKQHLKPCLEKIGKLIGTVADAVSDLYLTYYKPFVDWCIATIIPVLAPVFETLGSGIMDVFGAIGDIIGGIIDVLSGVIDFVIGVFTGNWEKAWTGIKDIFSGIVDVIKGIWTGIKSVFSTVLKAIKKIFDPIANWFKEKFKAAYTNIKNIFSGIGNWFKEKWNSVKNVFSGIPGWFKEKFNAAYSGIKNIFSDIGGWFKEKYKSITDAFSGIGSWFKGKFQAAYACIKNIFSGIGKWFKARYDSITKAFSGIGEWFRGIFTTAWNNITGVFSNVGAFFSGIWDTIKSTFSTIGSNIGNAVGDAFKSVINGIISMIENTINKGIGFINNAINFINKLGVGIPSIKPLNLPKLAQGGYVKANTPQLAVIGDNRHQGEVVAPEDKLRQMAMEAVQMAGGNSDCSIAMLTVLKEILMVLKELDPNIVIDGKKMKDIIVEKINRQTLATGVCEIIT